MTETIILVDENDRPIGFEEKVKAHQGEGKLHRSFSIFIFNSEGKMLLQQRASKKYHFGGLWSNACCSHPNKGEELSKATHRKLKQEMGFDTNLKETFTFIYKVKDSKNNMTEHEFDHVFIGTYDKEPKPNLEEVEDWKWADIEELKKDIKNNPEKYSFWFKKAFDRVLEEFSL